MSTPFVGEIRMFAGNFAIVNFAKCDGQLQQIAQNETLFALIGTTYGGDGVNTFAYPNLQGRVPLHQGQGLGLSPRVIGETAGVEQVTITTQTFPAHTHTFSASTASGTSNVPTNNVIAEDAQVKNFTPYPPAVPMNPQSLTTAGSSLPHENMMPSLTVTFLIALFGIFPSQ